MKMSNHPWRHFTERNPLQDPSGRRAARALVEVTVAVNGGKPWRGGLLHDISTTGASVQYPVNETPVGEQLQLGQEIVLEKSPQTKLPGRIVRTFAGGFAIEFDFSLLNPRLPTPYSDHTAIVDSSSASPTPIPDTEE